ncbi:MAG: arginine deiminase family protein [Metamycoplasmataceae bacterium]
MISVYSEIGKLTKVLVHTPGKEIEYISPQRLDELLFSALLEPIQARKEHKEFIKVLESQGIEVVQLIDLVSETWGAATESQIKDFIEKYLDEVEPVIESKENREKIKKYLLKDKNVKTIIANMMSGLTNREVGITSSKSEFAVDPMPNLYFTRDPFASIGSGISINRMKYKTRRRETIFSEFIFSYHPEYKTTHRYAERTDKHTIEGGDIFIYDSNTLVIGVSERTEIEQIESIAKKLATEPNLTFKKIIAINVPKKSNLMHLDTWLTMIDSDKFLYSPNMMGTLKMWEIDLGDKSLSKKELKMTLEEMLQRVTGKKPILVPVAGHDALQLDIDLETHFDATNYLVIDKGVVVGYDRNKKTEEALKKAGVKVLSFNGNQLSLGMGSARCMSMPLVRKK